MRCWAGGGEKRKGCLVRGCIAINICQVRSYVYVCVCVCIFLWLVLVGLGGMDTNFKILVAFLREKKKSFYNVFFGGLFGW